MIIILNNFFFQEVDDIISNIEKQHNKPVVVKPEQNVNKDSAGVVISFLNISNISNLSNFILNFIKNFDDMDERIKNLLN